MKYEIEVLEIKRTDTLEELDENLMPLALRGRYFEKSYDTKKERKLKNVTRKKIDGIDIIFKKELEKMEELEIEREFKTDELLSDLYYDKEDVLHKIFLKVINQKNQEYQKQQLMQLKNYLLLKK